MKRISIRTQFILYFLAIAVSIGGSALFILHRNYRVMEEHAEYLEYIAKFTSLAKLEDYTGKILRQLLEEPTEEAETSLLNNWKEVEGVVEELRNESTSVEINLRLRVVSFLCKRFSSQSEEMIRLKRYAKEEEKGIDYQSSYYQVYLNLVDTLNRMDTYVQEALVVSAENNITKVNEIKRTNQNLRNLLFLVVSVIVCFAVYFYFSIANYISGLIQRVVNMTNRVSKEERLQMLESQEGPREVEELVDSFNQLLITMDSLYQKAEEKNRLELKLRQEEVETLKMRELLKEARLQGLQLQIQPHFLFNTLNVISMMAMLGKNEEVYELIMALSKFLRHSLKKESSLVVIEEELDMIRQYLYILKVRLGDQLSYEVEVKRSHQSLELPLFTLQPLVENAFKHGLEDSIEPGYLRVSVIEGKGKPDVIMLRVFDNGRGMEEEELAKIREKVNVKHIRFDQANHIGIENVVARLYMVYEGNVRYCIHSSKKRGTIFTIYITRR